MQGATRKLQDFMDEDSSSEDSLWDEVNTDSDAMETDQLHDLPELPYKYGPQTVTLDVLLEFVINQTYRDLQILTELLQKKSERDRKITIASFANTTRNLFLRLLALVKWARSTGPLDKLNRIDYFLDKQSEQFVDTADTLTHMARGELVAGKWPLFQVLPAVNILSAGNLQQPESIKTNLTDDQPLTKKQQELTLKWMENVVKYRLIQVSAYIPSNMTSIKVANGIAKLHVPNEFSVYLILLPVKGDPKEFDDDPEMVKWRWCVEKIDILVVGYECGFGAVTKKELNNQQLVDFCNFNMAHKLNDIQVIYSILHEVCLKRQLESIFHQAQYLSQSISFHYINVDLFDLPNYLLRISYWLPQDAKSQSSYSITFERDSTDTNGVLQLKHQPSDSEDLPLIMIQNGFIDFHLIFQRTIQARCRSILQKTRQLIESIVQHNSIVSLIKESHVYLRYNFKNNVELDEQLQISVNSLNGNLQCDIFAFNDKHKHQSLLDLEEHLNSTNAASKNADILKCLETIQTRLTDLKSMSNAERNKCFTGFRIP